MTDEDLQEFNSTERMLLIVGANNAVFSPNAKAAALADSLEADVAALEASGAAGVSGRGKRRSGTIDKNSAEDELEVYLRKVSADARTIKKAEPSFDNTFLLPAGGFSSQTLLDTARSYKENLTPAVIAKFGEYGSATVTQAAIQTRIDAVTAAGDEQNTGYGESIGATADTKAIIKRLKENRRTLKGIGENLIEAIGDAGLLAEWISACKLEKNKPKDDPPPTPEQ